MAFLLDEYGLKTYTKRVVTVFTDADQLVNYNKEMAREKRLILDGVRDHIVSHITTKSTTKEMQDVIASLYQNPFEQHKMFLKERLRNVHM